MSFIKNKHEVTESVKHYINRFILDKKKHINTLRTDRGSEYLNKDLSTWLLQKGIRHQTSTPHTPQHNSVSERYNRTLMESGRSNLYGSPNQKLPLTLWAEALNSSNYVLNRTLSRSLVKQKVHQFLNPLTMHSIILYSGLQLSQKLHTKCGMEKNQT